MAQPMLQITADKASPVQANLMPCRINHSGPIGATDAYWAPRETDGKKTAFFRGRKLYGQTVKLPEGYRGVVGARQDSPREQARQRNEPEEVIDVDAGEDEQEAQRQQENTGGLAVLGEFEEFVVWGHESTADAAADPYIRSVDEWLSFSEQIHSYPAPKEN